MGLLKKEAKKMVRILLACAGGMSTSLLMQRMMEEAEKRNLPIEVRAIPESTIIEHIGEFDVLLLGPQVRHVLPKIQGLVEEKAPVGVIDMHDYGTMNGERVLYTAIKMYKEFKNKK